MVCRFWMRSESNYISKHHRMAQRTTPPGCATTPRHSSVFVFTDSTASGDDHTNDKSETVLGMKKARAYCLDTFHLTSSTGKFLSDDSKNNAPAASLLRCSSLLKSRKNLLLLLLQLLRHCQHLVHQVCLNDRVYINTITSSCCAYTFRSYRN